MSLLDNARDSIIMGLEDFSVSKVDSKRLLSCTRNLFAGILLLFKQKLVELSSPDSNEVLIKAKVKVEKDKNGNIVWVGQGKSTVDVQQTKERFDSLGISVDWKRIQKMCDFRNDIEHYYANQQYGDSIRDLISNSFIVIRDFLRQHLHLDPKIFLSDESWNTLISISEVYEREKNECVNNMEVIDWKFDVLLEAAKECHCPNCGSGLITSFYPKSSREENKFQCKSCDKEWDFEDFAEFSLNDYFSYEYYLHMKEGDDPVTIQCPICLRDTYILEDEICILCGESVNQVCELCGSDIPPEEIDGSGLCGWCSQTLSKDD